MKETTIEVLLIEDNPTEADLIKEILSEARRGQYNVQHVQYLADGLGLLRERNFDVIILDLGLPDSQGLDTIEALRSQEKHTPVIVLTVIDDEDMAIRSLEMDAQDYLVKSEITGNILNRAIRYAIQRKRAAEELRRSEMKFAMAFQAAPVMFAISRPVSGEIINVNETLMKTCGYQREEMIGRTARELCIWDKPEDRDRMVQTLLEQGPVRDLEIRFRDKSGQVVIGLMSAELIEIEGEQYMLSLVKDISEQKWKEEALREAENRYRTLFNAIDEGYCIIEVIFDENEKAIDYLFLEINPAFEKQTGLRDALGKRMRELAPKHEEHWFEIYGKIALTGEPVRFQNQAESLNRWYDVYAFRFGQAEKRQVAILFNDITERTQEEEKIVRLNVELAARALELENANGELDTFTHTVSHDLRNPLNNISIACQAIETMGGDNISEEMREYLKIAISGTKRMSDLIDTLLIFSRSAHTELRRKTVDLTSMARIITANLRLTESGRRVIFRIAEGLTANADRELLQVVLENLLGNAWKYTGREREAVIDFCATEIDGTRAFFVRDNGPGFTMAEAEELFLPFRRLEGAAEFSGHGIGLATVARIIGRHGGRVWAEGEPGNGATFYFTLQS